MEISLNRLVSIAYLSILLWLVLPAQTVIAADITVDAECSLADAIQAAESDSAISGCPAGDGADTIHLTGDVRLEHELPQVETEITIEGNGYTISGIKRRRLLTASRRSVLTLRDLTLRNFGSQTGGAIHNSGTLSIENCTLRDNRTFSVDGGAILNYGRLTVTDSVFSDNVADQSYNQTASGGAIFNDEIDGLSSELTVINTTFRGNWAAWSGGAIAIGAGTATVIDSQFERNSADEFGGAIDSDDAVSISGSVFSANAASYGGAIISQGALSVSDSQFIANTASASGGAIRSQRETNVIDSIFIENTSELSGGAIKNDTGVLSVSSSYFSGNSSKWGGAISSSDRDWGRLVQLIISDSVFFENFATDSGGALFGDAIQIIARSSFLTNRADRFAGAMMSFASHLTLIDSSFVGNLAESSVGGLYVSADESAYLAHLTIVQNSAEKGGGIVVHHDEDADNVLELHNSLIAANAGGDCTAQFTVMSNNLIADGSCDPALSGDPLLGKLVEPEDGSPAYYPLLPNSPAIDAANPEHCTATDQTGTPRPQGDGCDIGAVEFMHE